jgi:hypothetical protein
MRTIYLLPLLLVAACSSNPNWVNGPSHVQGVSGQDTEVVAQSVADFVKMKIRPDDGPITIDLAPNDTTLGPKISSDLTAAGYILSDKGKHELRYDIQPFEDGILTLAFIDQDAVVGTRPFKPDHQGHLQPTGPYAIRELSADQ